MNGRIRFNAAAKDGRQGILGGTILSNIQLFESKTIRSTWNETEQKWYFSVADVVEALTDTVNARDYIKKMRKRDPELK